jgi:hypothetical protein
MSVMSLLGVSGGTVFCRSAASKGADGRLRDSISTRWRAPSRSGLEPPSPTKPFFLPPKALAQGLSLAVLGLGATLSP